MPHSNQNPSFFPVERSVSIRLSIHISATFHHIIRSDRSHTKIILTFLSCDFTIVTGDGNANYTVCLSFPGSQPKSN